MRALSNADFLDLWEDGQRLHALDRGLLAIGALDGGPGDESAADWTLGRRNQALAELYGECFGPRLRGWTECERCGEKLEFEVDCRSLVERQEEGSGGPIAMKGRRFRAPTSRDLARVAGERDPEWAALKLVELCRIRDGDECGGNEFGAEEWRAEDVEELGKKIVEADPLAEILLSFECPACKSTHEQPLDLPEFLWAEVEAVAKRLLSEIHILARAYGWSEDAVLSLSDKRRAMYLQMVQA
ncbi:MAG: hypothetical protein WBE72_07765 [Terracidiphilus sp.]